ncbi:hypothetical protein NDU88_011221 [Pleurodeles waltl]|uniref:Uncharacterized protein n=1 Tax=Pleurodeles waltl TaxID=8319 RepID=A0AAV7QWL5_PLEWA|nr:hypothetical protein NDU88_011221 [Pleurodeles waltl]
MRTDLLDDWARLEKHTYTAYQQSLHAEEDKTDLFICVNLLFRGLTDNAPEIRTPPVFGPGLMMPPSALQSGGGGRDLVPSGRSGPEAPPRPIRRVPPRCAG